MSRTEILFGYLQIRVASLLGRCVKSYRKCWEWRKLKLQHIILKQMVALKECILHEAMLAKEKQSGLDWVDQLPLALAALRQCPNSLVWLRLYTAEMYEVA